MNVGIVGSIASGKSTACKYLCELGAEYISADVICHSVLEFPEIKLQIQSKWNLNEVDRKVISKIVFNDVEKLYFLENITQPIIKNIIIKKLASIKNKVVVIEAPLIFEANWIDIFTEIWFIDTPENKCLEYCGHNNRTPLTKESWKQRSRLLISCDIKKKLCHRIINNNGSIDDFKVALKAAYNSIQGA